MRLDRRLSPANAEDEQGREDVADRVDDDRERCRQEADQHAGEARARELRRRPADLEPRVAFDELIAVDDRRQVALVGDVEEDREAAVHERDDVQLPDRQGADGIGERDRDEADRPPQVPDDQDRAAPQPVDPDAGRQAEEDERQELDRPKEGELERRDLQDRRGHERQREERDLRPEDADGLGGPELQEVWVTQQSAARPGRGGQGVPRAVGSKAWGIVSLRSNTR